MYPVLVDFGTVSLFGLEIPLRIGSYGLVFLIAILAGWFIVKKLGREVDPKAPWTDIYMMTILSGFIGAKLLNGVVVLPDLMAGRTTLFQVFLGGGVWLGGAIAGVLCCMYMARLYGLELGRVVDVFFVGIPLAHGIGRIACLLGGCCYGGACTQAWAIVYTDPIAQQYNGTPLNTPLHPTPVYEFGLEMINFAIVYALWRMKPKTWTIFATWTGLYGIQRFFLEFLRADERGAAGGLSTSQWISIGMVVVAAIILYRLKFGPEKPSRPQNRATRRRAARAKR